MNSDKNQFIMQKGFLMLFTNYEFIDALTHLYTIPQRLISHTHRHIHTYACRERT